MKQTQVPKPISFGCPWIPLNALDAACQIRYPTTAKRRGVARREHRNSSITHCMFWLLPKANRISWPTSSSTYLLVLGRITFPRRFFISLSTKELIRAWTTRSPRRTPLAISAPRRTSSSRAWPLLIAACTPHGWVPPKGTGTSLIYSNLPYLWLSMVCLLATFWAPAVTHLMLTRAFSKPVGLGRLASATPFAPRALSREHTRNKVLRDHRKYSAARAH